MTLAVVNQTLLEQNKILVGQAEQTELMVAGINEIRDKIEEMIASQLSVYDALEKARERPQFGGNGSGGGMPALPSVGGGGGGFQGLTGIENFFNNLFGTMLGGAFGATVLSKVGTLLGRGLKWGAIAFAADSLLNMVFENFDVPENVAQELTGDTRRAVFGAAAARMLGLKGKWALIAAAAGFFYDEANNLIGWITENSESAKAAVDWLDSYTQKFGVDGQSAIAGAGSIAATAAAYAAGRKVVQGGMALARNAPQLIRRGAQAVATNAPTVLNAMKGGASKLYGYGMRALSTAGFVGTAPLAATAATIGVLGASTDEYKDMLAQHPEMAPMNNGAGPGLVRGKYLIQNGLIEEAIQEEKRKGTYKPVIEREIGKAPTTMTLPASPLAPMVPGLSGDLDAGAIADFLATTPKTPIVRDPNTVAIEEYLRSVTPAKPQVVVVPVPQPAPAPAAPRGGSSTSIFTPPVNTTDRLDLRDRISRPW